MIDLEWLLFKKKSANLDEKKSKKIHEKKENKYLVGVVPKNT